MLSQGESTTLNFTFTLVRSSSRLFCKFGYIINWFLFGFVGLLKLVSSRPQNTTSNKYHLSGISLVANWSDSTGMPLVVSDTFGLVSDSLYSTIADPFVSSAPVSASNSSLDYLRSTLGRSYMCNAQQTLVVVSNFSVNTFRLQVQPFNVTTNQFATGENALFDFPSPSFLHLCPSFTLTVVRSR